MKIYRVDMTNLRTSSEEVPQEWRYLGGRALTSAIVAKEVDPTCHPLGRKNKLVFAPGLLTGTSAANSGRLSVGAKSPLTGGIKESNTGGSASQKLAKLGIKAVIIEGLPREDKYYSLHIDNNGVKIQEETELIGQGNYEVIDKLSKKHGDKINKAAGFTEKDDQLPEFFKEQIPPHNTVWDFTTEELQEAFNVRPKNVTVSFTP